MKFVWQISTDISEGHQNLLITGHSITVISTVTEIRSLNLPQNDNISHTACILMCIIVFTGSPCSTYSSHHIIHSHSVDPYSYKILMIVEIGNTVHKSNKNICLRSQEVMSV